MEEGSMVNYGSKELHRVCLVEDEKPKKVC